MKLNKIIIDSYRCITKQELQISQNCIGFVGLNESGKTNILRAISSLGADSELSINDKSKITNELPKILFHFRLEDNEKEEIKRYIDIKMTEIVLGYKNDLLRNLEISEVVYLVYLLFEDGEYEVHEDISCSKTFTANKKYLILNDKAKVPDSVNVVFEDKPQKLNSFEMVNKENIPEEYKQAFSDVGDDKVGMYLEPIIKEKLEQMHPQVIFWEYSDRYLIPSEITYDDFIAKDEPAKNSAPLYNVFLICKKLGVNNLDSLKEKISEWKQDSSQRKKDSLILCDEINKYICNIWEDCDQKIFISLEETKITIHINDPKSIQKNFYAMEARSQGFKTFISFILTIAAEADTGCISNFILLLDEPETHLHPSGVRYMRNELLKLSAKNNYIFYATHSIFMIDRKNLKRHIIVSKNNEMTSLRTVQRNNITQESVIYEALGTRVDEFSIHSNNIMLEGETDLAIFKYYCEKCIEKDNYNINDYQMLDGGGTKRIIQFFSDKIIPTDSEWVIILDHDSAGKEVDTIIHKKYPPSMQSKIHIIFYDKEKDIELEDILPDTIVNKAINTSLSNLNMQLVSNFKKNKLVSSSICEFKSRNNIIDEKSGQFDAEFKNQIGIELVNHLKEVTKERSIKQRMIAFQKLFPKYFIFISKFLDSFKTDQKRKIK